MTSEEPEGEREFRRSAYPDPLPKYEYSRTKASATSSGLWGRIAWTILLCVLPVMWLLNSMFPAAIVYAVIAWPLALRSIWKKTYILPESGSEERTS